MRAPSPTNCPGQKSMHHPSLITFPQLPHPMHQGVLSAPLNAYPGCTPSGGAHDPLQALLPTSEHVSPQLKTPPGLLATRGNKTPVPTQSVSWPTPQPYLPPCAPPCLPSSHADVLPRSFPEVKPPRSSLPQAWDACHLDGHTALPAHPSGLCSPA